jgi:hypothetical protein
MPSDISVFKIRAETSLSFSWNGKKDMQVSCLTPGISSKKVLITVNVIIA